MAYYADLAPCTYFDGEHDKSASFVAVGWLEGAQAYSQGPVSGAFFDRLIELLVQPWQAATYCGWHPCSLPHCPNEKDNVIQLEHKGVTLCLGITNLFIPSPNCLFVAPSLIAHYIAEHAYCPPQSFQSAVMQCPDMCSVTYFQSLRQHQLSNQILFSLYEDALFYQSKAFEQGDRQEAEAWEQFLTTFVWND